MNMPSHETDRDAMDVDRALLFSMMRIRAVEESIAERYSQWKMRCPTRLSSGQEAVPAAIGLALKKSDLAVSGHRAHGHYLGKGGDLKRMLAEIYGKESGCARGRGGSMHLIDQDVGFMGSTAIVGGTIPVGVGLALGGQLRHPGQVSCIFLGDAAVEEGVFYESANFAALRNLPVLFICENNRYSVYTPLEKRQPFGRAIHEMVAGIGIESCRGDGNDARDVLQLISDAVDAIRDGGGPRFLLFDTYRHREHCGPNLDDDLGYRSEDELAHWLKRDPVELLKKDLLDEKIVTDKKIKEWEQAIDAEIEAAFNFAENSPFPADETAYTELYRE